MFHVMIRYGLLYGIALGIGFFGSYLILGDTPDSFKTSEVVGYSVMLVSSIAVIFGIKEYKEKHQNGQLTFLQGFGIGSAISAIAGFIFGLYNLVYLRWLNPEFTQVYLAHSEEQIRSRGLNEEELQRQLAELASYAELISNEFMQALLMFITVFAIGVLFAAVSAAAMRKPQVTSSN